MGTAIPAEGMGKQIDEGPGSDQSGPPGWSQGSPQARGWSKEQCGTVVASLGSAFAVYKDTIVANGITGAVLCDLNDGDLEELGISTAVHRKAILRLAKSEGGQLKQ